MPTITLMRGIQGSGKTTWARITAGDPDNTTVRVSRDDLRFQLFNSYHGVDEDLITEVETAAVRAALRAGKDVIIDAMHLYQRDVNRWQRLGYPVKIKELHAPLHQLLKNNNQRERKVPEDVIRRNYDKLVGKDGRLKKVKVEPEKYVTSSFTKYSEFRQPHAPEAYIFDIDGTLAHNDGHRSFYDYSKTYDDKVHYHVASVANDLSNSHHIVVVSGRKAEARDDTERWLKDNNIQYDALYMRDDGDDRPDGLVKYEILQDIIAPHYDVLGVFDDRPSVCEMWRNVGIPTFQVGDPEVRF